MQTSFRFITQITWANIEVDLSVQHYLLINQICKGKFAVVPTDKNLWAELIIKNPR